MKAEERPISFPCRDCWLVGIASLPPAPASRGVLIVVGGPQYRAGSHRQFTLLARDLAAHGVPAMRFDYRGMGDSQGEMRSFEAIDDDLRAAIDAFFAEAPGLQEVVIWALCDAAPAAMFYAHRDRRVAGLVLLNPWVTTETGAARTTLRHYYLSRLRSPALWHKIRRGAFDYRAAAGSLWKLVGAAFPGRSALHAAPEATPAGAGRTAHAAALPDRMFDGLRRFDGRVLLILSGNDLTAREFSDLVQRSFKWRRLLRSIDLTRHLLPAANHTFSRREWRDRVAAWTTEWVRSW